MPSAAIQHGNDGSFVYVVGADQAVELRKIALGPEEDDDTSVTQGLASGELVVVDGTGGPARRRQGRAAGRRRAEGRRDSS